MQRTIILIFSLILISTYSVLAQKVRETQLGVGFIKTFSSDYKSHWSEEFASPNFINLKVSENWYRNDHKVSLQKEIGLNLQYAKISVGGGGLGAGNYYSGKIISLFAEASLQLRFRIDSLFSLGIGPVAEYLITGANDLNNSYYSMFTNPPSSGDKSISGVNRDYFNRPLFGAKLSVFNSGISHRTTLGLSLSYLWTKADFSNFYLSNYMKVSLLIGFKHEKSITPRQE